jgi:hypothetical protein
MWISCDNWWSVGTAIRACEDALQSLDIRYRGEAHA